MKKCKKRCKTPSSRLKRMRRYYKKNRAKIRARQRWYKIRRAYGLTQEQYEAMWKEQGGKCAICRRRLDGPLHVDHDHDTNEVRALLCMRCNVQLGTVEKFGARAEAYLRNYGKTSTRR